MVASEVRFNGGRPQASLAAEVTAVEKATELALADGERGEVTGPGRKVMALDCNSLAIEAVFAMTDGYVEFDEELRKPSILGQHWGFHLRITVKRSQFRG